MIQLEDIKQVYFIGVGGIGMSAIARYFVRAGCKVSGYDKTATELTRALEGEGVQIHYGDADFSAIPAPSSGLLVVFTPAVPKDFAERRHVERGDYLVMKRAEVLGVISGGMNCAAIAGTHGKTTTTTMTTWLMSVAGLEPTAFLGGIANNFSTNYVHGNGSWVVAEADEFDRSFLRLQPDIAVILSADADHLDIYGDHANMLDTGFRAFANKVQTGGHLLVEYGIKDLFRTREGVKFLTFGIGAGDYSAHRVEVRNGAFHFDLHEPDGHVIADIRTALPGRHNVENTVAAAAVTRIAGGSEKSIRTGLDTFRGIARRFEKIYDDGELIIIDDYAHHPTELNAAIGAARELYPNKKLYGAFQPHLYSRTQDFATGFADALDQLDEAVLIPIYPAREEPIPGVTSQFIFKKMTNTERKLLDDDKMIEWAKELRQGVLLLLGAGDIDVLIRRIRDHHQKRTDRG